MLGRFLTPKAVIQQLDKKGMYKVCENELYLDENGDIYLLWQFFQTDNFTWINSSDWDIRCSHFHDCGCKYHQMVKVLLTIPELFELGLIETIKGSNQYRCKNIPEKYLEVVNVSGHQINNMFYRMLKASKAPKYVQLAYRAGVAFNLGWFFSGKTKIDLSKIYDEDWNCK